MFLGFNKDSKGYDGSGIVYSDLDRLCDGVMGFLSGVLEAVKDDDAVKKYITVDETNAILTNLQNSIGRGSAALSAQISEVRAWLQRYEIAVGSRTGEVIFRLGELKNDLKGKYTYNINAGDKLVMQLEQWKATIAAIDRDVHTTETNYVTKLDTVLKKHINHEINAIKSAIKMLRGSTDVPDFVAQVSRLDMTLEEQRELVDKGIVKECKILQNALRDEFDIIRKSVNDLESVKKDSIANTKRAIEGAKKVVAEYIDKFDVDYKDSILNKFHQIKYQLTDIDPKDASKPPKKRSQLGEDANMIKKKLLHVGSQLAVHVKNLLCRIEDAEDIRATAVAKVTQVVRDLGYHGSEKYFGKSIATILEARGKVKEVNSGLKKEIDNLEAWKKTAQGTVNVAIGQCNAVVAALNKNTQAFKTKSAEIISASHDLHEAYKSTDAHLKAEVAKIRGAKAHILSLESGVTGEIDVSGDVSSLIGTLSGGSGQLSNKMKSMEIKKAGGMEFQYLSESNLKSLFDEPVKSELTAALQKAATDGIRALHRKIQQDGKVQQLDTVTEVVSGIVDAVDIKKSEIDQAVSGIENRFDEVAQMVKKEGNEESVHSYLKDLREMISENTDYKLQSYLKGSVHGLEKIHSDLSAQLSTLSVQPSIIEKAIDEITNQLRGISSSLKNGFNPNDLMHTLEVLKKKLGSGQSPDGESIIDIHRQLNTLTEKEFVDNPLSTIQHAIDKVTNIIQHLEMTPADIDDKKDKVDEIMSQVYAEFRNVQNEINLIGASLDNADLYLREAITTVRRVFSQAITATINAVETLKYTLLYTTKQAFVAITTQFRSLFAEQHLSDLQALQKLVSTQLKIINCTINKDLNTGLKGFLKTLSGDRIDPYLAGYEERPKHLPVKKQPKSNLLDEVKDAIGGDRKHGEKVKALSEKSQAYFLHIFDYLHKDLKQAFASQPRVFGQYEKTVTTIQHNLTDLLDHITTQKHFDHQVPGKLDKLKTSLTSFTSSHFGNASYPVLDAFPQSLVQFVGELERMYVSRYEGGKKIKRWTEKDGEKEALTPDGTNGAKVFLSLLEVLLTGFEKLTTKFPNAWQDKQIHLRDQYDNENPLGELLQQCGYNVSKSHNSHEGHLRNKPECTGRSIGNQFTQTTASISLRDPPKRLFMELLDSLYDCLEKYNDVCHLSTLTAKRHPCSVYEMLLWLSGLTHAAVHKSKLDVTIIEVIEDINKDEKDDEQTDVLEVDNGVVGDFPTVSVATSKDTTVDAYPRNVSYADIRGAINHICSTAYDVLTTIAGHGDEFTVYACDFSNNYMKFYYPASGEECLDMILDVLRRMIPTLSFLVYQCKLSNGLNGWQSCKYGKEIMTAKWPCKVHPTDESNDKATCQSNCQPNCQAKCEVTCQVNCRPTSPLMSYLNDCLPGHLPHTLTKIGCKYECANCPSSSKKGMPCLLPLGFKGFSGSTRKGRDICDVLSKLINNKYIAGLFTLTPKPPSTLAEHFGFVLSFVSSINISKQSGNDMVTLEEAINSTISGTSIELYKQPSELTNALTDAYGSEYAQHITCQHAHLKNLTASDSCKANKADAECAPYLSNLSRHCYRYLAKNHSGLYLSWAIYLPWNFWNYLKCLYDAFCGIACQDWGCHNCLRGDKCKRGDHGSISDASKQPNCQCHSIVDCKGALPTLYSYGFTFGDPSKLQNENYPNTCADFCKQLKNVLTSDYFTKLFEECDDFLFTIREPFIWLNVALWLLSLLYLLHIMVIRLDLLHIKSHLHSPSSHRIAAQSLLAAARVNKFNRVFYLQP